MAVMVINVPMIDLKFRIMILARHFAAASLIAAGINADSFELQTNV